MLVDFENNLQSLAQLNKLAQILIPYNTDDYEINDLEKTSELGLVSISRQYINDESTPALLIYYAAKNLLGEQFKAYEPETIWLELERLGADVPEINRNKLMTVLALMTGQKVIADAYLFKNAILGFNDEIPNIDSIEEATPEQLAWGIQCLRLMETDGPFYFDYEPVVYTAVILHRHGFILAPRLLSYCQDELDKLNKNTDLKPHIEKILKAWRKTSEVPQSDLELQQLVKITRVNQYVKAKYQEYREKLDNFLAPEKEGEKVAFRLREERKLRTRDTGFYEPNTEIGTGGILGDEKSGSIQPLRDVIPPKFKITVFGA